ncbi:MAG TPA: VWA domain-containing protein [Pyrinomonadaceae bacterium]|jgi:von Willebrand factor type A domain-containing protein|nr:VWA domain-containing protein [Pyrinomonadaceae bacterium]
MSLRRLRLFLATLVIFTTGSLSTAQDKPKFSYGILIDNTGSMRSQFDIELALGKAIVGHLHDHGPVSIFDFRSEGVGPGMRALPMARIDASMDERLLNRTIDNLYVEGGQTTLLDAIDAIANSLQQNSPEATKIIILITDGEDRESRIKKEALIQKLKQQKIAVFAIGLTQQLEKHKSRSTDLLNFLTKETGGRAVIPKKAQSVDELVTALAVPIQ